MAEYGSMFSVSILASILFLGGWHGPIPFTDALGLTAENGGLAGYVGQLIGATNVIIKGTIGVCVMMWVRWTLPRLRIDQVMATCLKYCTPIAAAMFLGATIWQLKMPDRNFFGVLPVSQAVYRINDGITPPRLPAPPGDKPATDQIATIGVDPVAYAERKAL